MFIFLLLIQDSLLIAIFINIILYIFNYVVKRPGLQLPPAVKVSINVDIVSMPFLLQLQ